MLVSLNGYAAHLFAVLALGPLAGCSGKVVVCEGGTPVEGAGAASGYEKCDGDWVHRPQVVECASVLPRADATCDPEMIGGGSCTKDADCNEQANGFCGYNGGELGGCYCNYGCTKDADCGDGQICVCGDPVGYCASASCSSDADCGGDKLCATYVTEPGCGGLAFACQSPDDQCASDADCAQGYQCTLEGDHRICGEINCAIGRPFLVEGSARVAPLSRRRDWCAADVSPRVAALDSESRMILAEEWSKSGQMEHASIAAFARFAMQLLGLGAPPELLVETHAAMADETAHARACFALASAYAGAPIGPGKLSLDGALTDADMATVVRLAIVEGCIGETVAAVEAAEASARAEDPEVQAVLARIAQDEGRHAELAWRFVRWALVQQPALARIVEQAFADALAGERAHPCFAASAVDEAWLAHGVARGSVKAELRRRVVDAVVAPAAALLVTRTGPRDAALAAS